MYKLADVAVVEATADGGRIRINTASVDRDRDRVLPRGARIENYLKNPVVQWGHNYWEPWSTIGRTTELTVTDAYIEAAFELRPAASEADPQHVVRLLWEGGWIRAASIGFDPRGEPPQGAPAQMRWNAAENEFGGYDFYEWELLEWSLVPIPANQDALRLAAKALMPQGPEPPEQEPEPMLPERVLEALSETIKNLNRRLVR